MTRLFDLLRRRPLLTCSLLANAALATGWTIERRDRAHQLEDVLLQVHQAEGRYIGMLGDWDAAVTADDEQRIAELSELAGVWATAHASNARFFTGRGSDLVD